MEGITIFLLQTGKVVGEVAFSKLPHKVRFHVAFVSEGDLPTSLYGLLLNQKACVFKNTSVLTVILVNIITLTEGMFQLLLFNSHANITQEIIS